MRPIEAVRGTAADSAGGFSRRRNLARTCNGDAEVDGSRALIAIAPTARSEYPSVLWQRPSASFLAQLIATAQHAPQTRARRRAELDVAIARYRTAAADSPHAAGYRFTRSC